MNTPNAKSASKGDIQFSYKLSFIQQGIWVLTEDFEKLI